MSIINDNNPILLFDIKNAFYMEIDACNPMHEYMWISKLSTENSNSKINGFVQCIPLENGADFTKKIIDNIIKTVRKSNIVGVRQLLQTEKLKIQNFLNLNF